MQVWYESKKISPCSEDLDSVDFCFLLPFASRWRSCDCEEDDVCIINRLSKINST